MKKVVWVLLDNRIGSRHQAEGVANYLDPERFEIIKKEITYTRWAALPNFLRGKTLFGVEKTCCATLKKDYPDLVISASRRTAPVARFIKKHHPTTKLIQLLHIGRTGAKEFTYIFAPEHDNYKFKADNICYTTGSPHFITAEKLETAKQTWEETFSHLPHPITALIIGGSIKKHPFTLANAEALAKEVLAFKQKEGGSLLITTSRRTGQTAEEKIISLLKDIPSYQYLWGNKGENPYLGFLSCADNLIVTGDSVSMCCEATATGKPLKIFTGTDWLTTKHLRFVHSLYEKGYASALSDTAPQKKPAAPLNIAKEIADKIAAL
jgi:hypothetical protein